MKKRLIYSALLVTGIVTMSSCGDDKSSAPQQAAAGQTQASESDAGADAGKAGNQCGGQIAHTGGGAGGSSGAASHAGRNHGSLYGAIQQSAVS